MAKCNSPRRNSINIKIVDVSHSILAALNCNLGCLRNGQRNGCGGLYQPLSSGRPVLYTTVQ